MSYRRRVILVVIAIVFSLAMLIMWLHATASDTSSAGAAAPVSATTQTGSRTAEPQQTSMPQNAGDRTEVIMAFFAPIMLAGILAYILSPRNKEWNTYTIW